MKRVFAKTSLSSSRRFAAGIDVSPAGVRVVVISQRLAGSAEIRVEHVGYAPLPIDAMVQAEIIDPAAVAASIVTALEVFFNHGAGASLRAAMALPPAATVLATLPLAQCEPPEQPKHRHDTFVPGVPDRTVADAVWRGVTRVPSELALDRLEPGVRAQAEALSGLERSALAVDWLRAGAPYVPSDHLTIAAAAQELIDARIETAVGAGLHLVALDAEPLAALRACRFDAAREVDDDEIYAVLWIGHDSFYLWALQRGQRVRELRMPLTSVTAQSILSPLSTFARGLTTQIALPGTAAQFDNPLDCAWVAGELDELVRLGIDLDVIGAALGCPVFEFDCNSEHPHTGASVATSPSPSPVRSHCRPAVLAVAFGLALRAVLL